jgi:hypothetical protein
MLETSDETFALAGTETAYPRYCRKKRRIRQEDSARLASGAERLRGLMLHLPPPQARPQPHLLRHIGKSAPAPRYLFRLRLLV